MAEEKKSVLLYCDIITTVEELTDEEAGKLFKHYLRYINDKNPVAPDKLTQIVFEPMKQTLKRDLKKWEGKKDKNSEKGSAGNLKRWHPDLYKQVEAQEITLEAALSIAKNRSSDKQRQEQSLSVAKIAVSVSDSVIVSDSEIKDSHTDLTLPQGLDFCMEIALKDDKYIRDNKTSIEELKLFNKSLTKQGKYEKTFLDYKSHFSNWKACGKMLKFQESETQHAVIAPQVGMGALAVMKKLQEERNAKTGS